MKLLDIGEVAAETGVRPSALRYYEEIGLIASIARRGLRRQFTPDVLVRLKLIALAQSAGFALEEISGMFGANGVPDLPRGLLRARADALERQIRELEALRDMLSHMAECPAPTHIECPTFRRLLDLAGRPDAPRRRIAPRRKTAAG